MAKFRKKPVVIDAVQFTHENFVEIGKFCGSYSKWTGKELIVSTLHGDLRVSPQDWIIRGVKGEFYPCKPNIFAATYDPEPA